MTTFLRPSVSSKGWHVEWESVPPGKSQSPIARIASVEETERMKPIDKALCGRVSESPGRNASEPTSGLEKKSHHRG